MKETVDLGSGFKLYQPRGVYPCDTDSVLLSAFAASEGSGTRFADLCGGSGVIPLLVCKRRADARFLAVEISKPACAAAEKNVASNGFSERIKIVRGDIREIEDISDGGVFDSVTVNPPYMKVGSGRLPSDEEMRAAVAEIFCTAEDVARAAAYLLKDGGKLFITHRAERMDEVASLLKKHGLFPRLIRPVVKTRGEKPKIFLMQAVKGKARAAVLPLVLYENGALSDEAARIYGE